MKQGRIQPARWAGLSATVAAIALGTSCVPSPVPSKGEDVTLVMIAEGLVSPVGLAAPNDGTGRLFVVDQTGLIRVIDDNGALQQDAYLDLRNRMIDLMPNFDERGLLGMAFHPFYVDIGRFYVFYSVPTDAQSPVGFNSKVRVSEFLVSSSNADRADADSERVLLEVDKPQFNHNGGQLAFGPDGYLYIGIGDGGGAHDVGLGHNPETGNGQDKSTLLGKILRIDVDGAEPYEIPPDNPFVGDPTARPEIWALGLRNPWRFSFDAGGEQRLFVGDAGQNLFEEISIITPGGNYGWNIREGAHCFDPDSPIVPPADCPVVDADGNSLIDPIVEYAHTDDAGDPFGVVVIGGYVYRGDSIPGLQSDFIFGDYSTGFVVPDGRLLAASEAPDGSWTLRELMISGQPRGRLGRFILAFGQDIGGEVYVLTTDVVGPTGTTGRIFRLASVEP